MIPLTFFRNNFCTEGCYSNLSCVMCAGILFRVSRRPYTKHRTSNDLAAPQHRSGANFWWFLDCNRWKYYELKIYFYKFFARQLCLNGRKDCNSIVTYYGFTILDLVRLQEGRSIESKAYRKKTFNSIIFQYFWQSVNFYWFISGQHMFKTLVFRRNKLILWLQTLRFFSLL